MKVFTGTVKETMLTAGISEQDYRRVADERADGNQDGLRIFTFLSAIFLAGMFLASFFLEFAADKRPLYATVFLVMVLLNLICGRNKLKESGVIACIYVFMGTLLGFGSANPCSEDPLRWHRLPHSPRHRDGGVPRFGPCSLHCRGPAAAGTGFLTGTAKQTSCISGS